MPWGFITVYQAVGMYGAKLVHRCFEFACINQAFVLEGDGKSNNMGMGFVSIC